MTSYELYRTKNYNILDLCDGFIKSLVLSSLWPITIPVMYIMVDARNNFEKKSKYIMLIAYFGFCIFK
jgi:hypothetical protein